MHELSIASGLAEKVLAFARAQGCGRVLEVRLALGEMTCLQAEQLTFCYQAITQETPLEGSILVIEPVAILVSCPHCAYAGRPKYWEDAQWHAPIPTLACPRCGLAAEPAQGHECAVKSIKYDRESRHSAELATA